MGNGCEHAELLALDEGVQVIDLDLKAGILGVLGRVSVLDVSACSFLTWG